MERNKKILCVRPFASPNKPPGRIAFGRYSNSVYRKDAVTDVARNTNFHPVWTGDYIGCVLGTNVFLSLTYFIVHIFTTRKVPSFASRTPTTTRPVLRNNQDNEVALLRLWIASQHLPPHLGNVEPRVGRYGLQLVSASLFHTPRTACLGLRPVGRQLAQPHLGGYMVLTQMGWGQNRHPEH